MEQIKRLRAEMAKQDVAAVLISDPANVGWLTGFSGSFGRVIVTNVAALFITDSRYTLQAQEEVKDMPTTSFASPVDGDEFTAERAKELGIARLGFESAVVTYAQWLRMGEKISGVELVPVRDLAPLRLVKSEAEIAKMRAACALADAGFQHILRLIQPGVTELDIALDLEFFIRRQGAEIERRLTAQGHERMSPLDDLINGP